MNFPKTKISVRSIRKSPARGIPKVKITDFAGENHIYPAKSISLPFSGKIMIPGVGCIPLHPGEELVIDGADSRQRMFSSKLILFPPDGETFCDQISSSLVNHPQSWQFERIFDVPVYWTFYDGSHTEMSFLNLSHAVEYFSKQRIRSKSLSRDEKNESVQICCFHYTENDLAVKSDLSCEEWKTIKTYSPYSDFLIPDYQPAVSASHMKKIQNLIETFEHAFYSWFAASPEDEGTYALHCMPVRLPEDWFCAGCMEEVPDFYKNRVLDNGCIMMHLPKTYDHYSKENIDSEIRKFISALPMRMKYWQICGMTETSSEL